MNKIKEHMDEITKVSNFILQQQRKSPNRALVTTSDGKIIGIFEE